MQNRNLVFFGEDWGRHPSTAQFIAKKLLARGYKIVWVDSLGLRQPKINKDDFCRIMHKALTVATQRLTNKKNIAAGNENSTFIHFVPLVIPFHKYALVRVINRAILTRKIRRILKDNNIANPVLVVACPGAEGVVGAIGESKSVYYCADEYSVFPGLDTGLVKKLEKHILEKIDCIIATSRGLYDKKKVEGKPTYLLPHGVEYDHFSKASLPGTEIPEDIRLLKRPIIGYHGLIQDLIDFDIIKGIARKRPDWSIVMIGDRIFDVNNVPTEKNIHFLGRKPYEELPNYIKAFDVCLIPYKIVERTMYSNPVKLREYLASGKPIVSTPQPEVLYYKRYLKIASDARGFVDAIEALLSNDTGEDRRLRMGIAEQETWEKVVDKFEHILYG
ncbi:MAG: glycosyltransferase [Thermodesulfobacteriota bacterium]